MLASMHAIGSEAITISDTFTHEKLKACSIQLVFIQTMSVASGRVFTKCGRAVPRYWMIKCKPLAGLIRHRSADVIVRVLAQSPATPENLMKCRLQK